MQKSIFKVWIAKLIVCHGSFADSLIKQVLIGCFQPGWAGVACEEAFYWFLIGRGKCFALNYTDTEELAADDDLWGD